MFQLIKQFFSNVSFKIITDFFKDWAMYLFPILISSGGYMITSQVIGWSLIAISSSLFIYILKCKIIRFLTPITQFCSISNKLSPFDTRFLITDNKYLDMKFCVENLSNQVISVTCDVNKSYFTVDGIKYHNIVMCKNNLYPYATHSLQIPLMDLEKVPNDKEFTVKIYAIFKYGAFGCELNDTVSLRFESVFLLSKNSTNDYELAPIKIIQPASPIS